jgi:hypothetical protein
VIAVGRYCFIRLQHLNLQAEKIQQNFETFFGHIVTDCSSSSSSSNEIKPDVMVVVSLQGLTQMNRTVGKPDGKT